jgi:hypothetical protein
LIVVSSRAKLASHISELGFDPQQAAEMARFSAGEVGWFVFYLAVSVTVVWIVSKGWFAARAKAAGIIIGIILITDLGRANKPWIQYYDYKEKYANNGVFEVLSNKAYEHRVSIPPLQGDRNFSMFQQIYGIEWLQHQFPFYNIQSLDQPQEPRMAWDKAAYREALGSNLVRQWELTNTRFVCGMATGFVDALNQQPDPVHRRFKLHTRFNFFQNPGTGTIGARVEENGAFALIEFTGALPRAKLYSQWEVNTNTQSTLVRLANPTFDPAKTVMVLDPIASPPELMPNAVPGTVEFTHYEPKHIELKVGASTPSVLLLNDKFDAGWNVFIDGRPGAMLRCNFMMRGVQVPPGNHTVTFRFQPRSVTFYIALGATMFGLSLWVFVWFEPLAHPPSSSACEAT